MTFIPPSTEDLQAQALQQIVGPLATAPIPGPRPLTVQEQAALQSVFQPSGASGTLGSTSAEIARGAQADAASFAAYQSGQAGSPSAGGGGGGGGGSGGFGGDGYVSGDYVPGRGAARDIAETALSPNFPSIDYRQAVFNQAAKAGQPQTDPYGGRTDEVGIIISQDRAIYEQFLFGGSAGLDVPLGHVAADLSNAPDLALRYRDYVAANSERLGIENPDKWYRRFARDILNPLLSYAEEDVPAERQAREEDIRTLWLGGEFGDISLDEAFAQDEALGRTTPEAQALQAAARGVERAEREEFLGPLSRRDLARIVPGDQHNRTSFSRNQLEQLALQQPDVVTGRLQALDRAEGISGRVLRNIAGGGQGSRAETAEAAIAANPARFLRAAADARFEANRRDQLGRSRAVGDLAREEAVQSPGEQIAAGIARQREEEATRRRVAEASQARESAFAPAERPAVQTGQGATRRSAPPGGRRRRRKKRK